MNFTKTKAPNNITTAFTLLTVVIAMVVLAYASVPLYNYFCKVTGFGGTPKVQSEGSLYITEEILMLDSTLMLALHSTGIFIQNDVRMK